MEVGHVVWPPPPPQCTDTCGAFHGSGPSNFNVKLHIFHGCIPAREKKKRMGGEEREGKCSERTVSLPPVHPRYKRYF